MTPEASEPGRGASLCVIPARGASKRIPRKNLRPFAGVPLVARTIATVLESGVADRVVVSTDDPEIADVSRAAGADVPFLRPAELADDHTPTIPVVADAINRLAELDGREYDTTWVVYPTAALLRPADLVDAREAFGGSAAEVAMSVVESPGPIERVWRRGTGDRGRMVTPDHARTRTQDLPAAWFDAGQFYVGSTGFWLEAGHLDEAEPLLLPLPRWRAVDIDTEEDWALAERLHAAHAPTEAGRLEERWSGGFDDR